ncbi:hypothetical protein VTJ04DRAFT_4904 [Mycothermus thermophilus]|uniref:uncharacterized protein n=1 Tax=Humicola insolens TaxID=85995 RepID=UPI0037423A75
MRFWFWFCLVNSCGVFIVGLCHLGAICWGYLRFGSYGGSFGGREFTWQITTANPLLQLSHEVSRRSSQDEALSQDNPSVHPSLTSGSCNGSQPQPSS